MAKASASNGSAVRALGFLRQEKLQFSSLFHLTGADDYLREEVIGRLRREAVDPQYPEFNFRSLTCGAQLSLAELDTVLLELPMLTDRRILLLNSAQSLTPPQLKIVLQSHRESQKSQDLVIVLNWSGATPKKAAKKPLTKGKDPEAENPVDVLAEGTVILCEVDDQERPEWLNWRAQQLGLKFEDGAQARLLARSGPSLRQLFSHLSRLSDFCGKDPCTSAIVEDLVPIAVEVQTWRWTAAIGKKNMAEGYSILDSLLCQDENAGSLMSYLNSYLLGLAQLKELKVTLKTPAAIAAALTKKTEFQVRKSLEEADSFSTEELKMAFDRLEKADLRIKTGTDPRLMLQLLVLQLCSRKGERSR